ncbi:MAG: monovalent cation/H(+) antiporter subunit G [Thermodesulfobacteriota bacterium]
MAVSDWLSLALTALGAFFFFAGTVGLLRFPDVYTRLHALTKADGLGLGLTVLGLIARAEVWEEALQLVFIWVLVMFSSATACHLVARTALRTGVRPWRRP